MTRSRFTTATDALGYIQGGHGRVTARSTSTGVRYTYRFRMPKDDGSGRALPIFVSLLRGPDNTAAYTFLGCFWERDGRLVYAHGRKAKVDGAAGSVKAIAWIIRQLGAGRLHDGLELWHEGVCGRCGRTLTVPESIESGIGPVCAGKVAA